MKTMRITVRSKSRSSSPLRGASADHPVVNESDDVKLYQEHDKIVLKETGEILTVDQDLSDQVEPGIVVKETIGRLLLYCEVRPAGRTRERREAGIGVIVPDLSEVEQKSPSGNNGFQLTNGDTILVESYESRIRELEQQKAAFVTECDAAIVEALRKIADIHRPGLSRVGSNSATVSLLLGWPYSMILESIRKCA